MNNRVTLREACSRVDYGLTTSAVISAAGPKFLRITDIDGSFIDWNEVPSCLASAEEVERYSLASGDIVVARTGASTGRSQWVKVESPAVFASYLVRFRVQEEFDSRFVEYVLQSRRWSDFVNGAAHGKSAQPNMSATAMAAFQFEILPLAKQRAIAGMLGALDEKIASNKRTTYLVEELVGAVVGSLTPSVPLLSLAKHQRDGIDPGTIGAPEVEHYSLPAFDNGQLPESTAPDSIKSGKFLIRGSCVLVSKLNPRFPRVWDVPEDGLSPMLASTEFLVLEPIGVTSSVLGAILSHPLFSSSLIEKAAGTSGSHQRVKPADVMATLVVDPRILGDRKQELLTSVAMASYRARFESRTLSKLRDTLLPHLMSGKLRVKDAEEQVEAVV